MMSEKPYILAIEAAIAGGSLSLCRDGVEIAGRSGPSDVSRAEDLLFNIDLLLRENGTSKKDLGLIAVSAGPGSFTGIRIGIATALGLKNGLGIPMSSQSALKAMVHANKFKVLGHSKTVTAAVPSGRNAVCLQSFTVDGNTIIEADEPHTIREDEFFSTDFRHEVFVHRSLFEKTVEGKFTDCGTNIARFIAAACNESPNAVTPPLFISKSF